MQRSIDNRPGLTAIWQVEALVSPVANESWSGKGPFSSPRSFRVREGAGEVLEALKESGFTHLALTRYPKDVAMDALQRAGMAESFSGVYEDRRPGVSYREIAAEHHLDPEAARRQLLIIGDLATPPPDIPGLTLVRVSHQYDSVVGADGQAIKSLVDLLLEKSRGNFEASFDELTVGTTPGLDTHIDLPSGASVYLNSRNIIPNEQHYSQVVFR